MGLPISQTRFDADAYLAWEAAQSDKSEYVAGDVFAMVGVRRVHALPAFHRRHETACGQCGCVFLPRRHGHLRRAGPQSRSVCRASQADC